MTTTRELLHIHNEDEGKLGLCIRCWKILKCYEIQILPEKFFGQGKAKIRLCDNCATKIESFVPRFQRLAINEYYAIFEVFVRNHPLLIRGYDDEKNKETREETEKE